MNYIHDMSFVVAEKALIAVDFFFDNMTEQEIIPYLSIVVPKLSEVVMS